MNSNKDVLNIIYFIVICILCIILGSIGYYTYSKSKDSFISFIGMVFLVYACISLSYTLMKKQISKLFYLVKVLMNYLVLIYISIKHHPQKSFKQNVFD